ncbi:hypothetical protein J2Y69_003070 [Microbacterium resistens]|uniref:Uncharacterized protein n=1 Tax=Microbacterium resistens TaxID=156977 RepID=A0ABU1SFS1_9MICO|nr:DUF6093 family protein [Microbacterium resistens]MDR6868454.1 hypothetical protein [Microbacterium resistens]
MPISVSALHRGQRAAQADMRDRCRITAAPPTRGPWNPVTLDYDPPERPVIYEGKCKLTFGAVEPRDVIAADQQVAEQAGKLAIPVVGTAGVAKGHRVEVLSSLTDPDMSGSIFAIGARRSRTNPTSRRFQIEETQ